MLLSYPIIIVSNYTQHINSIVNYIYIYIHLHILDTLITVIHISHILYNAYVILHYITDTIDIAGSGTFVLSLYIIIS